MSINPNGTMWMDGGFESEIDAKTYWRFYADKITRVIIGYYKDIKVFTLPEYYGTEGGKALWVSWESVGEFKDQKLFEDRQECLAWAMSILNEDKLKINQIKEKLFMEVNGEDLKESVGKIFDNFPFLGYFTVEFCDNFTVSGPNRAVEEFAKKELEKYNKPGTELIITFDGEDY